MAIMDIQRFEDFIQALLRWGLEHFKLYYGVYHGIVTRNDDPEARGRIQAHVPEVGQRAPLDIWILPAFQGSGPDHGEFNPPELGDGVWINFVRGDPSRPKVYWGGWYGAPQDKNDVPTEFQTSAEGTSPYKRGWRSKAGHMLIVNDKSGEESLRLVWHKPDSSDPSNRDAGDFGTLSFEKNGDIILTNKSGSLVHLSAETKTVQVVDENGNYITMKEEGIQLVTKKGDAISLKGSLQFITQGDIVMMGRSLNLNVGGIFAGAGASSPFVKGTELLSYLNQLYAWAVGHVHPYSPPSPSTGPSPAPPPTPTPTMLSQANKTK